MKKRNKTGYYLQYPTHFVLLDECGHFLANVNSYKELEQYGKKHGYFFRGSWK